MNIPFSIKLFFYSLGIMLTIGCSKNSDGYTPIVASSMQTGVLISVGSSENEDLLSDENFADKISISGNQSNKSIPFSIEKITIDSKERYYIYFAAERPDEKNCKYKYNDDRSQEADGQSIVTLKINEQKIKLQCYFHSFSLYGPILGASQIILEKIEYDGKTILRDGNVWSNNIIIHLDASSFSLK